jgi:hypothetical protein
MGRLFEIATFTEWKDAVERRSGHLDIWQALDHLMQGPEEIVKIRVMASQLEIKRKRVLEYAQRKQMVVCTCYDGGWLYIRLIKSNFDPSNRKRGYVSRKERMSKSAKAFTKNRGIHA